MNGVDRIIETPVSVTQEKKKERKLTSKQHKGSMKTKKQTFIKGTFHCCVLIEYKKDALVIGSRYLLL